MQHTKALTGLKINDADQGLVTAVFATLNVVDSDGDVTIPGAFTTGERVRISAYNHESWNGALPVGKGIIAEQDGNAILEGEFFLDLPAGRDTFEVVKQMGELQEWSYGFDVLDAAPGQFEGRDVRFLRKLKVYEVSPVLLGAGVGTRTLATKGLKLSDHIDAALADVDQITTRVADAVAQRAGNGQKLSEATLERAAQLESSIKRLREALAIEPRQEKAGQTLDLDVQLAREHARLRL